MQVIEFYHFAETFLYSVAELHLSRYSRYNSSVKKTLSTHEFSILFKNTYHFLGMGRMNLKFLQLLYKSVDQNKDAVVSYD